jgi:hypothetical protein
MSKYVLVKFLESMPDGTEFPGNNWPLHLTIVGHFTVTWNEAELTRKLRELLSMQPMITVCAQHDELFGPQRDIPVTVLEPAPELISLHNKVVTLLKTGHSVFDNLEFIESGYRPHVSIQADDRLHEGDVVQIEAVSLVDMAPGGDTSRRRVAGSVSCESRELE